MTLEMTTVDGSVVREDRVSTVIALLPTSVQNRFSPLRHIRRSISLSNICVPSFQSREASPFRPRSEGNTTPPEPVESAATSTELAVHQALQVARTEDGPEDYSEEAIAKQRFARQGKATSEAFVQQPQLMARYLGAQLIGASIAGSRPAHTKGGEFERDAYLDGLAYLLRGLPDDLTSHERERLRRSMPADVGGIQQGQYTIGLRSQGPPSTLYRLTSCVSLRLVIAFSMILPYILLFLQWLAGLERKYKVSENVGAYTLQAMNTLAYHGGRIVQASTGHEWRAGQLLLSRLLWTIDEVSRGVIDGVDQGLSGVGAQQLR